MLSLPMAICKLIHTLIMNLIVPKVFTDCVACDSIKFKGIYIYIFQVIIQMFDSDAV